MPTTGQGIAYAKRVPPRPKLKMGYGLKYVTNPYDLVKRMQIIVGEMTAGNDNKLLKNELSEVADLLLRMNLITKKEHLELFNNFILN